MLARCESASETSAVAWPAFRGGMVTPLTKSTHGKLHHAWNDPHRINFTHDALHDVTMAKLNDFSQVTTK